MGTGRRAVLRSLAIGGAGAVAGLATGLGSAEAAPGTPRSAPGYGSDGPWRPPRGHVDVVWAVNTADRVVALTFDDGPMPHWTPMVHDILDAERVRATFFLVGERLVRNARLVAGRMDRHEAGNHPRSPPDLAPLDPPPP